ncbi:Sec-independent protein translocase protein TatB [Devosia nitrariae]|uniref:Sec-independent protein translocase protein TatB n=1 Tax=Devosia nitrariae TaxID=2071872 RepID=A0ABQ5WDG9_9HYPH|nr:Sec-independent protein translocase protein TatB [Devosia nitrariae]GLQ57535.1 hypothetical protein GCM10010862_47940 [Devosia nitrariae]
MLGLGWIEMLVVGVVALIVIGPKDLPMVMQRIGKFAGQVRRMGAEFQREINKTTGLDEVRNLRQSITEPLRKSTEEIRREFNAMTPSGPKPSGLIKPSDPAKESVADEIRAAAGMGKAEPVKAARTVTPKPPAKAEPVVEGTVERAELQALGDKPAPVKAPRARKGALDLATKQDEPGPAKAPTAKKPAARRTSAKTAASATAEKKPAPRKAPARRKAPAKPAETGGEG